MGISDSRQVQVTPTMEAAIRKEALDILCSGWYLVPEWHGGFDIIQCCVARESGVELRTLLKVIEALHESRSCADESHNGNTNILFKTAAEKLPLRHALQESDFEFCDLSGCETFGSIACILMQRIVTRCLLNEAHKRLWHVAKSEHCSWSRRIRDFHPNVLVGTIRSIDVASAGFDLAVTGIPPLTAVAIASAWRTSLEGLQSQYAEHAININATCKDLPQCGMPHVEDAVWNWAERSKVLGRGWRDVGSKPWQLVFPPFVVVEETSTDSHVGLEVGSIVNVERIDYLSNRLILDEGASCQLFSSDFRWRLSPFTRTWRVAEYMVPVFAQKPDRFYDGKQDGETKAIRHLEFNDIVAVADPVKFQFKTAAVSDNDAVRIWNLDGTLVYTEPWDNASRLEPLMVTGFKRELCQAFDCKDKHWAVQLILQESGAILHDTREMSSILSNDCRTAVDLQLVANACPPLQGGWLQIEDGDWVPIFNVRSGSTLLHPITGPIPIVQGLSPVAMDIDSARHFFNAWEFPQLAALAVTWKELREEALQLWRECPGAFIEYEGHKGWMACALKLWGHDVVSNMSVAPKAARAMRNAGIDMLTTFAYSVLLPGCHIQPHSEHRGTTGIRAHLGLMIPTRCALRVGPYAHVWSEGEWLVFNGNRCHEVWNIGEDVRIVLLVDFGSPKVDPISWPGWMRGAFNSLSR